MTPPSISAKTRRVSVSCRWPSSRSQGPLPNEGELWRIMRGIQNTEFQENVWKKDNYTFYEINKQLSHEPDKCCAKHEQCIGAQTVSRAENGLSMTNFKFKCSQQSCSSNDICFSTSTVERRPWSNDRENSSRLKGPGCVDEYDRHASTDTRTRHNSDPSQERAGKCVWNVACRDSEFPQTP